MKDILEMARELGEAIQQDERCIRYQEAKTCSDADEALQELIGNFNLIRMNIGNEMNKEENDKEKIGELNIRLKEVYQKIMQNENMLRYQKVKEELDSLMKQVNNIIMFQVTGQVEAEGCGGSCSTCGGCG